MKKNFPSIYLHKKLFGIALFISASFTFSIYFLFIQLPDVLSRVRLGEAIVLWMFFTFILYNNLSKDLLKLSRISPKILFSAIIISLLIGLVILSLIVNIKKLPYNLLLLPIQKLNFCEYHIKQKQMI